MKKVLFIIDSLGCGGAEKSLVSLLPLLDEEKYDLNLWVRSGGGIFDSLIPKHVHLVEPPADNFWGRQKLKLGGVLYSVLIRWHRLIGKKVHLSETLWRCQGWAMSVPVGEWDVVVAYQQGIPTYLTAEKFHDVKKLAWINVDIFKAGYDKDFNSCFYRKIDCIVVVSEALNEMMCRKMPEFSKKFTTIFDVINPYVTKSLAGVSVKKLKVRQDETVLVTTGRLVPQKGYDLAVSAAVELKKRGLRFKWYIIGEGPERSNIEEMKMAAGVDDEIVLLGLQRNPYAYMAQADIYVQTSKFEGFGMTVAEAKILGKPIVSTDFEVIRNQIVDGRNGLVVRMDGKSIAEAVYRLVSDETLRRHVAEEVSKESNNTCVTELIKVEKLIG